MADDAPNPSRAQDAEIESSAPTVTFKVKSSGDHNHTLTMPEVATVLDLKTKLASEEYENVPADRQRLIYSGRVMKNEEPLSVYKIKAGNTIHMVKSAASNTTQAPAATATVPGAGVPTNMAAGTSTNNPLVDLTGARFAGLANLPNASIFGADGGMGAPPSDDDMANLLEDPNMQQTLNEALNNPAMIDMMINSSPLLRDNPFAREMLQSPNFRAMLTNPQAMRQAARMRRQMGGMDGLGEGGNGAFPAPGATDTTPAGSAATPGNTTQNPQQPLNPFGGDLAGNPFATLFNSGGPPTGAAAAGAPNPAANPAASNPFGALFGGAGSPFGPNGPSPEVLQQAMQMLGGGAAGAGGPFGNMGALGGAGGGGLFGGAANTQTPAAPADTRPPEERYAEQLRQLNDMGFFDFDRNIEALRRSGGSVTGAVENLLR